MDLILNVKDIYFQQAKSGLKTEEYRLDNEYWRKKLEGESYDKIIYCSGYPKREDTKKRIVYPYVGWSRKIIIHPHFGDNQVKVFAIVLTHCPLF
jgi:hypothetical protein